MGARWHADGEDWHDTMSRIKSRMARASLQFFVTPWECQFHKTQWSYAIHASRCSNTGWTDSVSRWDPPCVVDDSLSQVPKRNAGRPRVRWDDRFDYTYIYIYIYIYLYIFAALLDRCVTQSQRPRPPLAE